MRATASWGSVVTAPSPSTATSGGSGWPEARRRKTRFSGMLLVAMSSSIGSSPSTGRAKLMGLVPLKGFSPPCGTTMASEWVMPMAANPCRAAASV